MKQKALQDRIKLRSLIKQVTEERDAFVESQKEKEKESVEEVNTEEMSVKQKKQTQKFVLLQLPCRARIKLETT